MLIELNQLNEILAKRKIRKESRTRAKIADRRKVSKNKTEKNRVQFPGKNELLMQVKESGKISQSNSL